MAAVPGLLAIIGKVLVFIWSFRGPASMIAVFATTMIIIFTSNWLNGPLAKLGPTHGIIVLNILSQVNNYAFTAAIDAAWESIQWGPMLNRGIYLSTFLAVSATSGMPGWLKILFTPWASHLMGHARSWSLLRIAFWCLVQFPGIIFMTQVNPETAYLPVNWTAIAGGIGIFDASASASGLQNGLYLSTLVMSMIKDSTVTISVPPISDECSKSSTCISYMIPGGPKTVAPWPFRLYNDSTLSVYMTRSTPVYQVDFWNAPSGIIWASDACVVYGVSASAFQLCVSPYGIQNIVTGWRFCGGNVTGDMECSNYGGGGWEAEPMWSTFVAVYRRKATIVADRSTNILLDARDLTTPELQNITVDDFSTAFNHMLYPFFNGTDDALGVNWWLTQAIANTLEFAGPAPALSDPLDFLRNLVMAPLFVYNPMTDGFMTNGTLSINTIQPGLQLENYINGSLARPISHLTITEWTMITYAAVGGFLLVLVLSIVGVTMKHQVQETSDFPVVDFLTLTTTAPTNEGDESRSEEPKRYPSPEALFSGCKAGDGKAILRAVDGKKVYSKEEKKQI